MKRCLTLTLIALLLLGMLTGCGAKSEEAAAPAAGAPMATEAAMEEVLYDETAAGERGATNMPANQKLIRAQPLDPAAP